jgi:hypothetical protein
MTPISYQGKFSGLSSRLRDGSLLSVRYRQRLFPVRSLSALLTLSSNLADQDSRSSSDMKTLFGFEHIVGKRLALYETMTPV